MRINVIVQDKAWKKYIKNPEAFLEKKTKLLINNYKPFYKSNLFSTLVLTNSKMIKDLNKKFRKKNKSTDIISFPFYKKSELRRLLKSNKKVYIGDIVINLNKINIVLEKLLKKDLRLAKYEIKPSKHHDVPGDWFTGPF